MRTDGQVDNKEDVELEQRREQHESEVDGCAGAAHAPVQPELVQRKTEVQREQCRQQRNGAVRDA